MRPAVCAHRHAGSFAALLAAVSLGLSACGSSTSGTSADPAMLAPASSLLYVSAAVRPEGTLKQRALADAKAFGHVHEPFGPLLQALAGRSPLGHADYAREVKPWLGRNAGLFATTPGALSSLAHALGQSLSGSFSPEALLLASASGLLRETRAAAALVLDTSDPGQARAFIVKQGHEHGAHSVSYRGASFEVDSQGNAAGMIGKFAVFGDEAGLKAAIDAHASGSSLKSSNAYAKLAAKGSSGALGSIYLNPQAAKEAGAEATRGRQAPATAEAASLLQTLPGEPRQAHLAIVPQSSSVAIDVDLLGSEAAEAKATRSMAAAANLLADMPQNLSIGLGTGEGGAHAVRYLALLRGLVSQAAGSLLQSFGGPALNALLGRLSAQRNALQRLFGGWTGPAAVFARGSGLTIQGALVIEASSPQAAHAAVRSLGAMLAKAGASVTRTTIPGAESALSVRVPGLPISLDVGAADGRLVIGLGPESVQSALSPGAPESASSAYASASSLAGGKPILLVRFPQLVAALESFGLNENQAFAPTISSLRSFGTLAGAAQPLGGGVTRLHLAVASASASGAGEG